MMYQFYVEDFSPSADAPLTRGPRRPEPHHWVRPSPRGLCPQSPLSRSTRRSPRQLDQQPHLRNRPPANPPPRLQPPHPPPPRLHPPPRHPRRRHPRPRPRPRPRPGPPRHLLRPRLPRPPPSPLCPPSPHSPPAEGHYRPRCWYLRQGHQLPSPRRPCRPCRPPCPPHPHPLSPRPLAAGTPPRLDRSRCPHPRRPH